MNSNATKELNFEIDQWKTKCGAVLDWPRLALFLGRFCTVFGAAELGFFHGVGV
jgi:hypothetical protein